MISVEIQNALAELEKKKEYILLHQEAVKDCDFIKTKYLHLSPRVFVGWEFGQLNGCLIHLDIKKISQLSEVLKDLGQKGWHQANKEPSDYAEIKRRTYELKKDGTQARIQVSGFLVGEVCRFVPIGKKEVEEYKLICDAELE
jgi:hypothetical protein